MKRTLKLVLATLMIAATCVPVRAADEAAPFTTEAATRVGRDMRQAYNTRDAAALWALFDDTMQQAMGSADKWTESLAAVQAQVGAIRECEGEQTKQADGLTHYVATCLFEKSGNQLVNFHVVFDAQGKVGGLWVRPEARAYASPFMDYATKTPLQLPFFGEWTPFWAGRTLEQNYHAAFANQRFAMDLVMLRDGVTHHGEGKANTDYYCYGQAIVAPAAGKVTHATDGVRENQPGRQNPAQLTGNTLVLDHGNSEYSLFAHLQRGSLRVKLGDSVQAGDTLGLCGNSGNSSEPHLHYQLQNSPEPLKGDCLPAFFVNFVADGKAVQRGEPVKGMKISRK